MENLWNVLQENLINSKIAIANIPVEKLILAAIVLTLVQILNRFLFKLLIKTIENFTSKSASKLDDELVAILKKPVGWLIFLGGLWLVKVILQENLSPNLVSLAEKVFSLATVILIAYIVYRASTVLGELLSNLTLKTKSEVDDLIIPYVPRFIKTIVIFIVVIKASEVLLGASADALIGLFGGVGITFGLLLKDIIYDWFCTLIIYLDNLYRPGDTIVMDGIDGFAQVLEVGLRSTKLRILKWNAIKKIPNSKMINGNLANWSQNNTDDFSYGIDITLKIEKIGAIKTARLCRLLQQVPKSLTSLHNICFVWFDQVEENARIINMRVFDNDAESDVEAIQQLQEAILALLKQENIKLFDMNISHDTGEQKIKKIDELDGKETNLIEQTISHEAAL